MLRSRLHTNFEFKGLKAGMRLQWATGSGLNVDFMPYNGSGLPCTVEQNDKQRGINLFELTS